MIFRAALYGLVACLVLYAGSPTSSMAATKAKRTPSLPTVDDVTKTSESAGPTAKKTTSITPFLSGGNSKEPVNISSDKLDFLNKKNKLIYTGHVVASQGDFTLKSSKLNIDLARDVPAAPSTTPADAPIPAAGNSSVRHMEADGPVTLISKDQVGTGDHATYDKAENKVYLKGNVTLSQGPNTTQGDNLVYDLTSSQAQVSGNVRSVFVPSKRSQSNYK